MQHSTVLTALILLIGATVPSLAEEGPNQTFTCTAKTFNECLMEAPCSSWKRSGPKAYKLDTKIIFRGNPVQGEAFSTIFSRQYLENHCSADDLDAAAQAGRHRGITVPVSGSGRSPSRAIG